MMKVILKTEKWSERLTSYDLLKALAVVLMILDHVGYYFYPQDMGFRVLGRLCVPIWFFLIGYAGTRPVPKSFWIGGAVLAFANLIAGAYLFPLSILFGLAFMRLWIDRIMARALRSYEALAGMFFLLLLLTFLGDIFVEYGTLGGLFAMLGALRARKDTLRISRIGMVLFVGGSVLAYILSQAFLFPTLSAGQFFTLCLGMILVVVLLFRFSPRSFSHLPYRGFGAVPLLQLLGRRTLEIYVLHVVFLIGISVILNPQRFPFLDFKIIRFEQLAIFLSP